MANFSTEDVYLQPRTMVGEMQHMMGINSDESTLSFYQGSSSEEHMRPTDKDMRRGEDRDQGNTLVYL